MIDISKLCQSISSSRISPNTRTKFKLGSLKISDPAMILLFVLLFSQSCAEDRQGDEEVIAEIESLEDISSDERFLYFQEKIFKGRKVFCGTSTGSKLFPGIRWIVVDTEGNPMIFTDEKAREKFEPVHRCDRGDPYRIHVEHRDGTPTIYLYYRTGNQIYMQVLKRQVLDYGVFRFRVCSQGWLSDDGVAVETIENIKGDCK